jgi:iron complex transport system substrate-binding protein
VTYEAAERAWEFSDDRGHRVTGARVPQRVVAYVRAGAALWEYGIRPVAVYGSAHDSGDAPDPAKAGELDPELVPYLGAGAAVTEETLRALRPDLIVDVTYDGKGPYALAEPLAEAVGVPVVALGVGGDASLRRILRRFAELAASLGADTEAAGRELADAEEWLRATVAAGSKLSAVALSAAGPEEVHLARPGTWPELSHLADLGLPLPGPGPGPGVNWLTTDWTHAVAAFPAPTLVLADSRTHATPPSALSGHPVWQRLTATATVLPWNPELPPAPRACAHFLRTVADALRAKGDAAAEGGAGWVSRVSRTEIGLNSPFRKGP